MKEMISIERASLIEAIQQVEAVVVSLDKVGSLMADLSREQQGAELQRFMEEFCVFKKLTTARRLLSKPFSPELGADSMDGLERALQGIEDWRHTAKPGSI